MYKYDIWLINILFKRNNHFTMKFKHINNYKKVIKIFVNVFHILNFILFYKIKN